MKHCWHTEPGPYVNREPQVSCCWCNGERYKPVSRRVEGHGPHFHGSPYETIRMEDRNAEECPKRPEVADGG